MMRRRAFFAALIGAGAALVAVGASAQTAPPPAEEPRRPRRPRRERDPDRPRRPPSPGQIAARERMRQCGAEWRAMRAAGRTEGRLWRDFRRDCLRRLRGAQAT
jgi:hypothetical protein